MSISFIPESPALQDDVGAEFRREQPRDGGFLQRESFSPAGIRTRVVDGAVAGSASSVDQWRIQSGGKSLNVTVWRRQLFITPLKNNSMTWCDATDDCDNCTNKLKKFNTLRHNKKASLVEEKCDVKHLFN